jgi:hypothetical protein
MKFIVSDRGLEPWDDESRACLNRLVETEIVDVDVLHERDMIEHRHILAQIGEVAKAVHMPPEKLRAELLIKTGNFLLLDFKVLDREVIAVSSMSRHHMRDHELHEFWHDAKDVIRKDYLPRIKDAVERERLAAQLSLAPA